MPTVNLYDFKGNIEFTYDNEQANDRAEDLGNTQFIPRGSVIKNSGDIAAMVVYTGNETKLMQNLGQYKYKRSRMEQRIQTTLLMNVCFLLLFIITCSIWNGIKTKQLFEEHKYLTDGDDESSTLATIKSVLSFYLLFNYLIPLDLAVMLEFNAVFYSGFIVADANMAHENRQMKRVDYPKNNSLNLVENLAEVEYIMSDKTGTLTQNELTFVALCSDLNTVYIKGKTLDNSNPADVKSKDSTLGQYVQGQSDFLKCLTICHDCTILELNLPNGTKSEVLTGASLDEVCLLNQVKNEEAACFKSRTAKSIHI